MDEQQPTEGFRLGASWQRRAAPPAPWSTRELWGGFALAVLLYVVGSALGGVLLRALAWENSPWLAPVIGPIQLLMALPPLWIIARYGPPARLLGLDRVDSWLLAEVGAALGLAFCGMLAWGLVLLPFGAQAQEPLVPLFGEGVGALLAALVVAVLLAPTVEEIVFRGFLFGGLRARMRPLWAATLSAVLFGALHLQPLAFPVLFLLGLLLALLYQRTGSLWAPILMHVCINLFAVVVQYLAASQGLLG